MTRAQNRSTILIDWSINCNATMILTSRFRCLGTCCQTVPVVSTLRTGSERDALLSRLHRFLLPVMSFFSVIALTACSSAPIPDAQKPLLHANARNVTVLSERHDGRTVEYLVDTDPQALLDFYRKSLAGDGWIEQSTNDPLAARFVWVEGPYYTLIITTARNSVGSTKANVILSESSLR